MTHDRNRPTVPAAATAGVDPRVLAAWGWAVCALLAVVGAWLGVFLLDLRFLVPAWLPTVGAGPARIGPLAGRVAADLALIGLFGLQHSVMARRGFKAWWTRWVPPAVERSTYVLATCLALVVMMTAWQPLPAVTWRTGGVAAAGLWALFAAGVALLVVASRQFSQGQLLGIAQATAPLRGRPVRDVPFHTPGPYRFVRHPLMTALLLVLWAAPVMTAGRALFAAGMTLYVLIGVHYEERDLVRSFGADYEAYRRRVPGLVPRPWRWRRSRTG